MRRAGKTLEKSARGQAWGACLVPCAGPSIAAQDIDRDPPLEPTHHQPRSGEYDLHVCGIVVAGAGERSLRVR